MKKATFFIVLAAFVLGFGWRLLDWRENQKDIKNEQANAQTQKVLETFLIPKIEKLKKENRKYPSSIKNLVPRYLPALPRTPKNFYYEQSKNNFNLYFVSLDAGIGRNLIYYSLKDKQWLPIDGFDWPREVMERAERIDGSGY